MLRGESVADIPGIRAVAGMPDLHPGKYGPVGCAILADRIHPAFVGSDAGCGYDGWVGGYLPNVRLAASTLSFVVYLIGIPDGG